MYTVKFIRNYDAGGYVVHSFSVPHYEVYRRSQSSVVTVTLYPNLFDTDGVERHISDNESDYDVCFVENSRGKTIDHIQPTRLPKSAAA
ncbi:hypothetical protein ACEK07_46075 [Alcanivoracaceae bacterium MT1]